ncbi:MAG TPA: toll/interleukin-1 receptor domain-containing protein [Nitrospiraceae bacterium]|nr:toll/interleukin-1 receptor domain-containing protein [Nitrospiraceae bacterium]
MDTTPKPGPGSSRRIFLSYAHEQRTLVEEIYWALCTRGYEVTFDRSSLNPGEEYHRAIQKAITACDLFVFLISPESVNQGSYTLTELQFAKEKWKNPSGKVLPVGVIPTDPTGIDPYLRAVTIFYPQGNIAADVAARVTALVEGLPQEPTDLGPTDDLQRERIATYRGLWNLTKLLPKWPRATSVTYDDLHKLSVSLRDWYFNDGGGMFLSRTAHTSYAALQDSLTAIRLERPSGSVTNEHYDAIRELCSALRSTLARDVGARQ